MNARYVNRAEPWLWGFVAPVPVLIAAVWIGWVITDAVNSVQPGIAVAVALLAGVGTLAKRRRTACAVAFVLGIAAVAAAVFGLVLYSLSHLQFG